MNRRAVVLAIAGGALVLFAGAVLLYNGGADKAPADLAATAPLKVVPPMAAPEVSAEVPNEAAVVPAKEERAAVSEPAAVSKWNAYVRRHSPIVGPAEAPVTIVEFFDPSCEACRAMYPYVKRIMAQYPNDVRLVVRYTPLHEGSDEAVRILETARRQGLFVPVLEALLAQQPQWAVHGAPQLETAWAVAGAAGLDVTKARAAMMAPPIGAALQQDVADAAALGVSRTPTFFVNEKPLTSFGPQQLYDLVRSEVEAVR